MRRGLTAVPNDLTTASKYVVASEIPPTESERADQAEVELGYTTSMGGDRFTEIPQITSGHLSA